MSSDESEALSTGYQSDNHDYAAQGQAEFEDEQEVQAHEQEGAEDEPAQPPLPPLLPPAPAGIAENEQSDEAIDALHLQASYYASSYAERTKQAADGVEKQLNAATGGLSDLSKADRDFRALMEQPEPAVEPVVLPLERTISEAELKAFYKDDVVWRQRVPDRALTPYHKKSANQVYPKGQFYPTMCFEPGKKKGDKMRLDSNWSRLSVFTGKRVDCLVNPDNTNSFAPEQWRALRKEAIGANLTANEDWHASTNPSLLDACLYRIYREWMETGETLNLAQIKQLKSRAFVMFTRLFLNRKLAEGTLESVAESQASCLFDERSRCIVKLVGGKLKNRTDYCSVYLSFGFMSGTNKGAKWVHVLHTMRGLTITTQKAYCNYLGDSLDFGEAKAAGRAVMVHPYCENPDLTELAVLKNFPDDFNQFKAFLSVGIKAAYMIPSHIPMAKHGQAWQYNMAKLANAADLRRKPFTIGAVVEGLTNTTYYVSLGRGIAEYANLNMHCGTFYSEEAAKDAIHAGLQVYAALRLEPSTKVADAQAAIAAQKVINSIRLANLQGYEDSNERFWKDEACRCSTLGNNHGCRGCLTLTHCDQWVKYNNFSWRCRTCHGDRVSGTRFSAYTKALRNEDHPANANVTPAVVDKLYADLPRRDAFFGASLTNLTAPGHGGLNHD